MDVHTSPFELTYIHQYILQEKEFYMLPVLGERLQGQPLACNLERETLDAKFSLSCVVSSHI